MPHLPDQAEQDLDLDPDLLFVTSFTQSMVACLDPSELGDPPTVTDTAQVRTYELPLAELAETKCQTHANRVKSHRQGRGCVDRF